MNGLRNDLTFSDSQQYVRDNVSINTRFIGDSLFLPLDKYPTIELEVPMGSGKTRSYVESLAEIGEKNIIAITSLRSLIDGILAGFKDKKLPRQWPLDDYREKNLKKYRGTKIAICANSLDKLRYTIDEVKSFVVIVDEVESVLSQLCTMEKGQRGHTLEGAYNYLTLLVKYAKNVIVADANLGDLTREFINKYRGDKPILRVSSSYLPGAGRKFTVWKDKALLFKDVLKSLKDGWQVILPCDSINQVEIFHKAATDVGYNGITITGDSKNDSKEAAFLANVNDELPKYPFVFYSPAMSTGVSIDEKAGQRIKVYGFFSSLSGPTAENAWQQLGRYRGQVDYNVYVENRIQNNPTIPDECLKEKEITAFAKFAELTEDDLPDFNQGFKSIGAASAFLTKKFASPYVIQQAEVDAKNNALNNNYLESLIRIAEKQGYTVKFKDSENEDELKAARVELKAAKAVAKDEYVKTIVEAAVIDKEEAARIKGSDKAKSYEVYSLERYTINDFYGEVTPEIVTLDQRGQLRKKIKRVLRIANPAAEREKDIQDIKDLFDDKLSLSHLKAHKLFCDVYRDMGGWAGYPLATVDFRHDGRVVTGHFLKSSGYIEWVHNNEKYLNLFHRVPKDFFKKPVAYLQTFLEDLGLELDCRKVKTPDKRVIKEYHANEDRLKLIRRFT